MGDGRSTHLTTVWWCITWSHAHWLMQAVGVTRRINADCADLGTQTLIMYSVADWLR